MENGNRLYICGTNAHNPKDYVIYVCFKKYIKSKNFTNFFMFQSNLTHLPRSEYVLGIGSAIAKCPYDPLDNSTAVYVEHGNPGGLPGLVSYFIF